MNRPQLGPVLGEVVEGDHFQLCLEMISGVPSSGTTPLIYSWDSAPIYSWDSAPSPIVRPDLFVGFCGILRDFAGFCGILRDQHSDG